MDMPTYPYVYTRVCSVILRSMSYARHLMEFNGRVILASQPVTPFL